MCICTCVILGMYEQLISVCLQMNMLSVCIYVHGGVGNVYPCVQTLRGRFERAEAMALKSLDFDSWASCLILTTSWFVQKDNRRTSFHP